MNRKLTDSELSMICEVIALRTGLHFPKERWAILRRSLVLAARDFGFEDISEFAEFLLSSNPTKDQIETLASYLTCGETYFWREPQTYSVLTDFILPELIKSKKNGKKSIRIWSAGCSSGEEPYSIAIAIHKTILNIEDWDISILATDINPKVLGKASAGVYSQWSFRNTPEWLKSRYFITREGNQFEIIPEIKKMVTFSCLSLIEMTAISSIKTVNIIFCRNVLMYLTSEWSTKIIQNFYNTLSEEGWLVVSSCELSSELFPQFTAVNFPGAILYRKVINRSIQPLFFENEEIPGVISVPDTLASTPSTIQPKDSGSSLASELTVSDKIFKIRLLADQGHLEEAVSICNKAIESDKLIHGLYFIRASILQEMDKNDEAIASLKQAIYIDNEYVMGHFTLGNLYFRLGNTRNAMRCFNNVLDLISKCANEDILPESEGLTVKYIREIILVNMQTQEIN
jgi:chemotaxis protein methyltransferase CheR